MLRGKENLSSSGSPEQIQFNAKRKFILLPGSCWHGIIPSLPTDTHFDWETPKAKQADPSPDGNHPEIPGTHLCTTCEDSHLCSFSRVICVTQMVPELNTCHVHLCELTQDLLQGTLGSFLNTGIFYILGAKPIFPSALILSFSQLLSLKPIWYWAFSSVSFKFSPQLTTLHHSPFSSCTFYSKAIETTSSHPPQVCPRPAQGKAQSGSAKGKERVMLIPKPRWSLFSAVPEHQANSRWGNKLQSQLWVMGTTYPHLSPRATKGRAQLRPAGMGDTTMGWTCKWECPWEGHCCPPGHWNAISQPWQELELSELFPEDP